MTEDQIAYLESRQAEFDELMGEPRSVREYAREYAHIPDLFERVVSDLDANNTTEV